ncbi:MAG: type II toxin-antitoxin system RelE/ParE family toxin [Deltaproteobacteria bacterium]|nr:type II toxin-antitoxin system RelE/ParE family toxin [Deltaproteobacteria bacterium]
MKVKEVFVLEEAFDDLNEGKQFYDFQEIGIGDYFWDCLISDIESLIIFAGIHKKKFGLHQLFSKRFPYTIYYEIIEDIAYVVAVLPMRRNPPWILKQITKRR